MGKIGAKIRGGIRRYILPGVMRAAGVEPLDYAYRRIGIGNWETAELSGEAFVIGSLLPAILKGEAPVMFDVGGHEGEYSARLCGRFAKGRVHAFEPVEASFEKMKARLAGTGAACHRVGLSDRAETAVIYDYEHIDGSQHASLYSEVFTDLHHLGKARELKIELVTLDDFCRGEGIGRVDFLKIDTEGNEMKVLRGAKGMLASGGIDLIQFEFNEMNVVSRVFLRDFYQVLGGFDFYRLMPGGLLSMGDYSARREVFVFQNILAVRRGAMGDAVKRFVVEAG